ncbi:hypothetical protein SRB5_25900 [Streptomyces sp. RB5]|uniref:AG1 protein n=1 Tax=Streptomyces smaragdinus TaxID=2585196 RepID=A0A7K0CGD5_9ACTN|nr:hypothetical protein [Streptomyces smaragdinus]MQY12456.1 hypothetical protein [Streptomyces smaragdinus]
MSFEKEWADLKSNARAMRLDQAACDSRGPGSGRRPDLVVCQDDLGKVGNEAYELHGRLRRQADIRSAGGGPGKDGAGSTDQAVSELRGHNFSMGEELSDALTVWGGQVRTLLQMCAHISNHLDFTTKAHAEDEAEVAASMRHRDGSALSASEISRMVE